MVGSTRSRVGFFLNKSRKLGFIGYNGKVHLTGKLHMHSSFSAACCDCCWSWKPGDPRGAALHGLRGRY